MRISDRAAVERILKAIADPENAQIMMRIRKASKSAQALSTETGIPQSTIYRKLDELKEAGLVMTEHTTVNAGKKVEFMIVTFSEIKMAMDDNQLRVDIVSSDETTNLRWLSLFRGGD